MDAVRSKVDMKDIDTHALTQTVMHGPKLAASICVSHVPGYLRARVLYTWLHVQLHVATSTSHTDNNTCLAASGRCAVNNQLLHSAFT